MVIFFFSSLNSVKVIFGFLNLFLDIWIRNPDPDSEYGSGSRIQAQIECGSNRIRIRNTGGDEKKEEKKGENLKEKPDKGMMKKGTVLG